MESTSVMIKAKPLTVSSFTILAAIGAAQTNVAASVAGGVATKSSAYTYLGTEYYFASFGNDGDRASADGTHDSLTSGAESNPWFEVSFASAYDISAINLFRRTDDSGVASSRIDGFTLQLFQGSSAVYASTGNRLVSGSLTGSEIPGLPSGVSGRAYSVGPSPVLADRVRITLEGTGARYLEVTELEALGTAPVPEPVPLAALGLGVVAMIRRRKRA